MSKGFGGLPGNMQQIMKQAQKMQEQIQKTQESLENYVCDGQSGGGAVKVKMDGRPRLLSIEISKEAAEDVDMLPDLILAAINGTLDQIDEHKKSEMAKVTGGMNIPGLF
jgi:nucleoid-associated protein EbfC